MGTKNFSMALPATYFHPFQSDISGFSKPEKFTYPFAYTPHPLSLIASTELQEYLQNQNDFQHNFGLIDGMEGLVLGKMFGVLVVESADGTLGYLAACSGKLAGTNQHRFLVPPIYDMLTADGFFLQDELEINQRNADLKNCENNPRIPALQSEIKDAQQESATTLAAFRALMKNNKAARKTQRIQQIALLTPEDYKALEEDLIKQSYRDQHEYDVLKTSWTTKTSSLQTTLDALLHEIENIKLKRKEKSAALQQRLFDQYHFLNAQGESKSVMQIFEERIQMLPPAGAGDCAAPKLMQYAYAHNLKPICLAEFWWGASPASEVRQHANFYPACKRKCEPILGHMLEGLAVDENPLLRNPAVGKKLRIIYEDNAILVVDKPAEFLSVPGINIKDSVYTRILADYPDITGPVIIHRLDMSTSGILLIAKNKEAHKFIQEQFINHSIAKRYTAMLDGIIKPQEGIIDLPLRVNLDDRPRQVVCYTHGKPAQTKFKVIGYENGKTRIHFFPQTGRTHQLRMHAAHQAGLNTPITGDDLYGKVADRLHLHAGYIQFTHPISKKQISFTVPDPF